jgi:Fe2+ or Zn2+ uptake regulation protein
MNQPLIDGDAPPAVEDARSMLRRAGLRITGPRVTVLQTLQAHPHSTADTIAAFVRAELGSVSTQAVYDVLHACAEAGLVRQIEPAGSAALFETRTLDNHHHLVCRRCGAVVDVDCLAGAVPCLTPADAAGFVVDEAEVVFWGLCPDCQ